MPRFLYPNLAVLAGTVAYDEAEVIGFVDGDNGRAGGGGGRRFVSQLGDFAVAWSRVLDASGRERLRALVAALPQRHSMRCHRPPFGLRIVRGGVETRVSVCFECYNAYVQVGDGESELHSFDAGSEAARGLLAFLREGATPGWRGEDLE